jgi:hypothetical protein
MIDVLHHHLTAAWSRAARSLDANRRRFLMIGASAASALGAVPVLARPAVIVARPLTSRRQSQGYRETGHVRRYYATTRL